MNNNINNNNTTILYDLFENTTIYSPYFVVLSNLIYLLCAIVLFIRGKQVNKNYYSWSWEIFDALTIAFISAMYHWCDHWFDVNTDNCIAPYEFIHIADYLYSVIIITTAFAIHLGIQYSRLYKCLLNFLSVVLVSYYQADVYKTILPILTINLICILAYNFRRWTKKTPHRMIRILYLSITLSCVISAYVLKVNSNTQNYNTYHSVWHILTGTAIIFSTLAVMPHYHHKKNNQLKYNPYKLL